MSRVYSDTVLPEDSGVSQDLTLGTTSDTVVVTAGASLNVNTVKDAGGNTIFTSDGSGTLSSMNSAFTGKPTLLDTNTFTDASSSAFTSLITDTYKLYIFKFWGVNAATDAVFFSFDCSINGGSSYGLTKTTTFYSAFHDEADTYTDLAYASGNDESNTTDYWNIASSCGSDADQSCAGMVYLFNPSQITFVKNCITTTTNYESSNLAAEQYTVGYITTASAIDAIDFKMSSGNMDGTIKMYGL